MARSTVQDQARRRDRYIRIACDNCRRRKTRCTGGCPCGRCTSLDLTCGYNEGLRKNDFFDQASSDSKMRDMISSLETQIQSIQKRLDGDSSEHVNHIQTDPLFLLNEDAMIRLIHLYHKEICHMYPVIEKDPLVMKGKSLRLPQRHASTSPDNSAASKTARDLDSTILYAVLAHAMYLDEQQSPVVSDLLFERVETAIGEVLSRDEAQLKTIVVLIVSSLYYVRRQQDLRAWRMIRFAVEQILELQLHTQAGLARYGEISNRSWALRVFWTVYVLDLRCSFANNLPATLEDTDIDPSIPEPDSEYSYLNAMVTYSRIASKIKRWTCKPPFQRGKASLTENGFLDFQITSWYSQLPPSIQFELPIPSISDDTMANHFPLQLRVSLRLRRNHMRILLHKPFLQSAVVVREHMDQANTAVEIAKDTIETLDYIGKVPFTFKAQPAVLSYFLISALAVFFPAAVHAPLDTVSTCWSEVMKVMDLVKAFPETYAGDNLQQFLRDVRVFVDDSGRGFLSPSPQDGMRPSGADTGVPSVGVPENVTDPSLLAEELYTLFGGAISCAAVRDGLTGEFDHSHTESLPPLDMTALEDLGLDFGEDLERRILDYGYEGFPDMFGEMD